MARFSYCKKGFADKKERARSCGTCREVPICKKEQAKLQRAMRSASRDVSRIFGTMR